jgi:hypothetical protein
MNSNELTQRAERLQKRSAELAAEAVLIRAKSDALVAKAKSLARDLAQYETLLYRERKQEET